MTFDEALAAARAMAAVEENGKGFLIYDERIGWRAEAAKITEDGDETLSDEPLLWADAAGNVVPEWDMRVYPDDETAP